MRIHPAKLQSPLFIAASLFFCAAGAEEIQPVTPDEVREALQRLRTFTEENLTDPATGAIYVNAATDRPVVAGEARNHDCLSEAVGQMMELALLRDDRAMFERQLNLARRQFASESSGFLSWKIALDPFRRADTSATLDDWRVAWACHLAGAKWNLPEATAFGRDLAEKIARGSSGRPVPPPAFNLGDGSPGSGPILLCYLHLPAMAAFVGKSPECAALLKSGLDVLKNFTAAPGMVPQIWDPSTNTYSTTPSDEVLALITLHYLHGVKPHAPLVEEAVRTRWDLLKKNGRLAQTFDPVTGKPFPTPAGASVYALYARLLLALDRRDDAALVLRRLLDFQNPDHAPYPGAIGGHPVFSFDQLEAMLALEDFLRAAPR